MRSQLSLLNRTEGGLVCCIYFVFSFIILIYALLNSSLKEREATKINKIPLFDGGMVHFLDVPNPSLQSFGVENK